jgi:hypothetical protein
MISKESNIEWLARRREEYYSIKNGMGGIVEDFDEVGKLGHGFVSVDELEEVDTENGEKEQPTYLNASLTWEHKQRVRQLLMEFIDCFAWEYTEMPGLSRELVEHRLPIKEGFMPHRQLARNFNQEVMGKVKEEVSRLLKAGFMQPYRYAKWVSNVVPVEKKGTRKIRVCVNFRDLNRATLKDEYLMPMADLLINSASGNKVISFLDCNVGYNQIFMAMEDVNKTAFRCLGFVGLFEWAVMTFRLKSAGTTYQWVMNLIFHDLLGVMLEIYIDDVVIKSTGIEDHLADLHAALERMWQYGLRMNLLKCAFSMSA